MRKKSLNNAKTGQYFAALINGSVVAGQVSVLEADEKYLCTNDDGYAYSSTMTKENRLGYNYAYRIRSGSPSDLSYNDVTEIDIISKEEYERFSETLKIKLPKIMGYDIAKSYRGKYIFGCGAVKLTSSEVRSVISIMKRMNKVKPFKAIISQITEIPSEEELAIAERALK